MNLCASGCSVFMLSRPFIIDLESVNGTFVNDDKIPVSRFYELKAGDGKYLSLKAWI